MSEEKQYLKDYIEQLNNKVKAYNDLDNLIHEFDIIDHSIMLKKESTKEKFNMLYNYSKVLNNDRIIREIIYNSFSHSSVVIKEKLKSIEKEFQSDCTENGFIFTIFKHINDIQNIYNILYTNKSIIDKIKDFVDIYNNTDIYFEVKDTIDNDLLSIKNKLIRIRDSIEMPNYKDNEVDLPHKLNFK